MTAKEQARAAVEIVAAVAEAIRELKEVPNGHLYAHLMGRMTFSQYETVIGILKNAKLIEESGHVLKWIGPDIPK